MINKIKENIDAQIKGEGSEPCLVIMGLDRRTNLEVLHTVFHHLLDQGLPSFLLQLLLSPLSVVILDQCIYLIRMSRYCVV